MLTWLNSHKGKIGLDITTNIEHILPTIQNINIRTIIVISWHSFQWVSVLGSGLRRFDVRFFLVVISGCCFGGVELWLGVKLLLWILFRPFFVCCEKERDKVNLHSQSIRNCQLNSFFIYHNRAMCWANVWSENDLFRHFEFRFKTSKTDWLILWRWNYHYDSSIDEMLYKMHGSNLGFKYSKYLMLIFYVIAIITGYDTLTKTVHTKLYNCIHVY